MQMLLYWKKKKTKQKLAIKNLAIKIAIRIEISIFVKEKGENVTYAKPEKNKVKRRMFCWMPKKMIATDLQLLSERRHGVVSMSLSSHILLVFLFISEKDSYIDPNICYLTFPRLKVKTLHYIDRTLEPNFHDKKK